MQINLTPDYSLLVIMVIFLLNYLIVSKFFLRPINQVIEARENETKSANETYELSMGRFNEATKAMEEKLDAARHDAADVRDRFRREAAVIRASIVERTHNEAGSIVSEAGAKLNADVATARDSLATESEALARLAAERILGRPL